MKEPKKFLYPVHPDLENEVMKQAKTYLPDLIIDFKFTEEEVKSV